MDEFLGIASSGGYRRRAFMKWFSLAALALILCFNACERHPASTLEMVENAEHHQEEAHNKAGEAHAK